MTARVLSMNVGRPRIRDWAALGATSIEKAAVTGPVWVGEQGLEGDQVSDTRYHGGRDQAVYAYAREDLDLWGRALEAELRDGQFGENLTTVGIDVNAALIGERWRVGGAVLEVSAVRIPCNDFKEWMGTSGYDNTVWVKRFAEEGRPGPYLRVLEAGEVTAGDAIDVVHRPDHDVTVRMLFRALTTDRQLLPGVLVAEALGERARAEATEYLLAQA